MEHLRKVDFDRLNASPTRSSQVLIERATGATTCKIMISRIMPGDGSPRGVHTHTFEQDLYVISGTLHVEIDGKQYEAGPGTLVVQPAGSAHRLSLPKDATGPATYLEFMAPLPAFGETRESKDSYVDPKTNQWVTPGTK